MYDTDDLTRLLEIWQSTLAFVKTEAQRDPDFAERWIQALEDRPRSALSVKLRSAFPDPFKELGERGKEGFERWLHEQDQKTLRAMIRSYKLDPGKKPLDGVSMSK